MASAAVKARLKALRKKHGLGEFRKASNSKRQVVSMAKRRRSRRSASTSGRSNKRYRRSSSRSSGMGKFVPLSGKEMLLDFGIGAITAPLSAYLAPYQQQYLAPLLGEYSDEAALAIVGSLAHAFGGSVSPWLKDGGKELFRIAVISSGQTAGRQFLGSVTPSAGAAQEASVYM